MEKWSWRVLKDRMTLMMRRDVVTRSSQSRWWIAHEDMGTANREVFSRFQETG